MVSAVVPFLGGGGQHIFPGDILIPVLVLISLEQQSYQHLLAAGMNAEVLLSCFNKNWT